MILVAYYGVPDQDFDLVYGIGRLMDWENKVGPNDYITKEVQNVLKCDYADRDVERLVYFFIVGNKGYYMQFQPIANSIHEYTQKVDKYIKKKTCTDMYYFDLKEEPVAFSKDLINKQANYIASKISEIVEKKNYRDINIVTHSVGSYVAMKAIDKDDFPIQTLRNVISLASPNIQAP